MVILFFIPKNYIYITTKSCGIIKIIIRRAIFVLFELCIHIMYVYILYTFLSHKGSLQLLYSVIFYKWKMHTSFLIVDYMMAIVIVIVVVVY